MAHVRSWHEPALLVITAGALVAGGAAWLAGAKAAAELMWVGGTVVAIVPAVVWMALTLWHGRTGVDLIAVLALGGTLVVHEYLAGALIAVMLASGRTLDSMAQRRASHDLRALLEHAPRFAHRRLDGGIDTVAVSEVVPGDLLVVGAGEVVPVDGRVACGAAVLDESVLTGESAQVERNTGEPVRSGVVNAGSAFELRVDARAEDSTYAGIARLAAQAGAERAPVVRLADRYATWFLPLALLLAGAGWFVTGTAVGAVAVLVVATPCPLLLAVPIALVSGMSRASRIGVIIRDGTALENLGHATTAVLDKTGTLTSGRPGVIEVVAAPGIRPAEVLRLAAAVDQASPHVLAEAIVTHARARNLALPAPIGVTEQPGRGTSGVVDGHRVEVGRLTLPEHRPAWVEAVLNRAMLDAAAIAWVSREGLLQGAILLRDPLRPDAPRTIRRLRGAGLVRVVMLTGDRAEPAQEVATVLGLDGVHAEQTPTSKVECVRAESTAATTVMVGDGVNDAPALAVATVGVAMGARGSTASSEAADVVLTADRLDRLADAMDIARRARRIAVQSAAVGVALSVTAMGVAVFGWLPPAAGALLQEGIDVAVILNALRALRGGRHEGVAVPPSTESLLHHFATEQEGLRQTLHLVRDSAVLISESPGSQEALAALRRTQEFLDRELVPHEHAEEKRLYPALAAALGGTEATATMSRMHAEIDRLSRRTATHLALANTREGIGADQKDDLLATLYGLYAVLRLHFAQEEESYFTLAEADRHPEATHGPQP
ncbi:P-type E1-E2 ATPase/heavy metal translocating P-type ATPase [Saccharopolyspora erythraea NRRL 2338]|uniref:Heavy metal translocating P-type ATPase n=3 Tax=Saccharopolyspora erythraea TaxID=1836 RepID=A4FCD7_SACEN|nr:heavy metal translocating P-type ATPase [Saccharopolyspora erythraea]PFG95476.1 P-type E1-E2 ATPase/heavy metal translocating P-type ATPase [Saccharopolyspora erythraea NRRL 2338]CAM01712.1 heavy metal translocating P-type ATPase [Saccharopolyspora erythraea NRRL 2338]